MDNSPKKKNKIDKRKNKDGTRKKQLNFNLKKNNLHNRMMGDQPPGLGIPYGNDIVGHEDQFYDDDYEAEYDYDENYDGETKDYEGDDYDENNDYYDYDYEEGEENADYAKYDEYEYNREENYDSEYEIDHDNDHHSEEEERREKEKEIESATVPDQTKEEDQLINNSEGSGSNVQLTTDDEDMITEKVPKVRGMQKSL